MCHWRHSRREMLGLMVLNLWRKVPRRDGSLLLVYTVEPSADIPEFKPHSISYTAEGTLRRVLIVRRGHEQEDEEVLRAILGLFSIGDGAPELQ